MSSTIRSLVEVALAGVSRVNRRALRADAAIAGGLLRIGLPSTIVAGMAAAALWFGDGGLRTLNVRC